MPKLIDLTGKKYGKLLVLSRGPNADDKRKTIRWWCICDCNLDKKILVRKENLKRDNPSCGCTKVNDLTNKRFGKLLVIKRVENNKEGRARWLCKCDCGKPKIITGKRLNAKKDPTRSCGCLASEMRTEDFTNKIFGALLAKNFISGEGRRGSKNERRGVWVCECICGKKVERKPQQLKEAKGRLSCGAFRCAADPQYIGPILPRDIAKKQNLKHYFPGDLCGKGHLSLHLVSNWSCLICHNFRIESFKKENPNKIKKYNKKSKARPESKEKTNNRLKERRNNEPIYRYVERIRNRVGKVLRKIKYKKIYSFDLNKTFEKNIKQVLEKQGLTTEDIKDGNYELDHIKPLCEWEWSHSHTANKLLNLESNSVNNLQFISPKDHKEKTKKDSISGNWKNEKIYRDYSSELIRLIETGKKLPKYLEHKREIIYKELKDNFKK